MGVNGGYLPWPAFISALNSLSYTALGLNQFDCVSSMLTFLHVQSAQGWRRYVSKRLEIVCREYRKTWLMFTQTAARRCVITRISMRQLSAVETSALNSIYSDRKAHHTLHWRRDSELTRQCHLWDHTRCDESREQRRRLNPQPPPPSPPPPLPLPLLLLLTHMLRGWE